MRLLLLVTGLIATHLTAEPKKSFSIQADQSRVIQIMGAVEPGTLQDGMVKLAKLSLSESPGLVDIIIDSPGGRVDTGFQFIMLMKQFKQAGGIIRCSVVNMAASMAYHIFLHCDERHALSEAFLLWHRARVVVGGLMGQPMTFNEAHQLAVQLGQLDSHIFSDIRKKMPRVSTRYLRYHFERETLHVASQLNVAVPGFMSVHDSIGNLLESVLGKDFGRQQKIEENKVRNAPTRNGNTVFTYQYQGEGK